MNSQLQAAVFHSVEKIPFAEAGILPSITLEYLTSSRDLEPFFHRRFSDEEFYSQLLEKKTEYTADRRALLTKVLRRQYDLAGIQLYKSPILNAQIEALNDDKSFVITTGHQLCLHTGPLYFLYKIISAIAMTRRLKSLYPEYAFIPVFWMASEDHDFDEINHFHHNQVRFQWNLPKHTLPVGRLRMDGYAEVLNAYASFLRPHNVYTREWLDILADSYLNAHSLKDATRRLVHTLLGHYGVVIVDGDDFELKNSFRFLIKNEILHKISSRAVKATSEQIGKLWFAQVHPRDINFFYLSENGRFRITKDENGRYHSDTRVWTESEMEYEIEKHPERFSPDVVTRPLYQEFILPNLAYIGGANELAYWFQLKGLFSAHQVPMPILLLRNSFVMLKKKDLSFFEKYAVPKSYIFLKTTDALKTLVRKNSPTDAQFDHYVRQISELYNKIEQYSTSIDKTLTGSVLAQKTRHEKALEKLRNKVLKAEMKRNEWLTQKLLQLRQTVFPNDVLQERYENAGQYYCQYGKIWLDQLVQTAEMPTLDVYAVFLSD
ncbi:MAG: bacillithiol biosynthesis cysteine-adding enzyme BshC [Thermaurantimonas sp.]